MGEYSPGMRHGMGSRQLMLDDYIFGGIMPISLTISIQYSEDSRGGAYLSFTAVPLPRVI